MKNFRNNSRAFLLVVSFLIGVSFIDNSRPAQINFEPAASDSVRQRNLDLSTEAEIAPVLAEPCTAINPY